MSSSCKLRRCAVCACTHIAPCLHPLPSPVHRQRQHQYIESLRLIRQHTPPEDSFSAGAAPCSPDLPRVSSTAAKEVMMSMINDGQTNGGGGKTVLASAKMEVKKVNRGVVYTTKEDKLFCLAWLGTSVDPFAGVEQRDATCFRKVPSKGVRPY